jgi:hypothetical protein
MHTVAMAWKLLFYRSTCCVFLGTEGVGGAKGRSALPLAEASVHRGSANAYYGYSYILPGAADMYSC